DILIRSAEDQAGQDCTAKAEQIRGEDERQRDASDRVESGGQAQIKGGDAIDARAAIDRGSRPMKERRLVHRRPTVEEGKKKVAMLDHLLGEHAFDGFVESAYVRLAETMEREQGG